MPAPENTTLAFGVPVDKFEALADEVRARGVVSEGNIISIMSM